MRRRPALTNAVPPSVGTSAAIPPADRSVQGAKPRHAFPTHPPSRHFERSRPTFSSAFAPAKASACAERNLSSLRTPCWILRDMSKHALHQGVFCSSRRDSDRASSRDQRGRFWHTVSFRPLAISLVSRYYLDTGTPIP